METENKYTLTLYQSDKAPTLMLAVVGSLPAVKNQADVLRGLLNEGIAPEAWYAIDISAELGKVIAKIEHDGRYVLNDGSESGRIVRYGVWFNEAMFK